MAVLVSSDLERPAILGPGRQEQLRLEPPPAPAPPDARPPRLPDRAQPDRPQLDRPQPAARSAGSRPAGRTKRPGGELTLDEILVVAWEGVTAQHQASCPVCRGAMAPRTAAAGPECLGGHCRDCGSTLA
jgi:hypothetical protein